MPERIDIAAAIIAEHRWLYLGFTALTGADNDEERSVCWELQATRLLDHADAAQHVVLPWAARLAAHTQDDRDDAARVIEAIRRAVMTADTESVGTAPWWAAVDRARKASTAHATTVERHVLPRLRSMARQAPDTHLARSWADFVSREATSPDRTPPQQRRHR